MTGGEVYVYDADDLLERRLNDELVGSHGLRPEHLIVLHELIERHLRYTGSAKAVELLDAWATVSESFKRVVPKDEVARLQGLAEGSATPA
jgi:glutamate synthase domain-containing protein 3